MTMLINASMVSRPTRICLKSVPNKLSWVLDKNNIYCGCRHHVLGGGEFGNPFWVAEYGHEMAIHLFEKISIPSFTPLQLEKLRHAEFLGCFCGTDEACHVDTLISASSNVSQY